MGRDSGQLFVLIDIYFFMVNLFLQDNHFKIYTGFIAMYATLASRDVDCCLIPESPFYLEGPGGLFEYIEKRIEENGHMVIVVAEGAGQDLVAEGRTAGGKDASGNRVLDDIGLWLSQKIKVSNRSTNINALIKIQKMLICSFDFNR